MKAGPTQAGMPRNGSPQEQEPPRDEPAPEAFEYAGDVRPEVVETIQERANKVIGNRELVVIDGYVGSK